MPQDHEPRRAGTPAAHRKDRVAAFPGEPVLVPDVDFETRAARDGGSLVGERCRIQVVGGGVDEPPGEVDPRGDHPHLAAPE